MDEIVRRLRKVNSKTVALLKEGMTRLYEVDEEDEMNDEIPEDDIDMTDEEFEDTPEDSEDSSPEDNGPRPTRGNITRELGGSDIEDDEDAISPDDEEEINAEIEDTPSNPLDNIYATHHQLGDEIVLVYSDGSNSKLKGVVDGYDSEGFYRIKWSNGMTTNGITDLALSDFVQKTNECVCGHGDFVVEGKYVVCDHCGRRIRESVTDNLTKLDKSRPKGKRMIRSEAHPMSTSVKPNINMSESAETDDLGEYSNLRSLEGEFWTRLPELVADIEELGYDVLEATDEHVVVYKEDIGDDSELLLPIGGTARTITLDFSKATIV